MKAGQHTVPRQGAKAEAVEAPPLSTIPAFLRPKTVAGLAHETTHDLELTADSAQALRTDLIAILQQIVSPVASGTAAQDSVVRCHFAPTAQMSHPLGYAIGSRQIACLLTCLYLWRAPLFPILEIIPVEVVVDRERLTVAMEVEAVMRMRWLGLQVPLLVQVFCELAPRRQTGSRGLWITYWSEHYSLRSFARMLPGRLAWLADWGTRRAVAIGSERLLRLLSRLGVAQWAQQHSI